MIMRIKNGGHLQTIVALLLVGVLAIGLLSTSVLAQQASSGGGNGASGNSNGGNGGSGAGGSHPGNAGGGGGSGGCMVINGPTKFVPTSTTTETQRIQVGSGNSNRPGNTYLIQERTVTSGEYQMTVYTTCTCSNTGQRETTSSTQVVGTDTRYSGWRTVSVVKG
jgi:hypothetical protein